MKLPELPPCIDADTFNAFVDMRLAMKKIPFTEFAARLIVKELVKMDREGYDANSSLEQAIMRGWRGVFPAQLKIQTRKDVDPALQKIATDSKLAVACPPELKAKLDALKRGILA